MERSIADVLSADPTIATTLPGKVWDRPLKRRGPFDTPDAFAATAPHNILPAAVVSTSGATADRTGPPGAYTGLVTVWLHGPEGPQAHDAMERASRRILALLDGFLFTEPDNSGVIFTVADRFGVRDDPIVPGAQLDYIRFAIAGLWP